MNKLNELSAVELYKLVNNCEYLKAAEKEIFNACVRHIAFSREEYKKQFYNYWQPAYDKFNKVVASLKYINASLWVTDCDCNSTLFGDFFYDGKYDITETFVSCDISLNKIETDYSATKIVSAILGETYGDTFWRNDYIRDRNGLMALAETLSLCDKLISVYAESHFYKADFLTFDNYKV